MEKKAFQVLDPSSPAMKRYNVCVKSWLMLSKTESKKAVAIFSRPKG
jgi:hypothetical protein